MSESKPAEKANEYAIEALKQIITLSSGILALTITFIKDALGDARSMAVATFLIPLSWFLLVISLWLAWVAMAQIARILGSLQNNSLVYVLDPNIDKKTLDKETKDDIKWTRRWARISQSSFQLGIACLTAFAIINSNLFFTSPSTSSSQVPSPTITMTANPIFTQTIAPIATPSLQQTPTQ